MPTATPTANDLVIGLYDADEALMEEAWRERAPRFAVYAPAGTTVVLGRGSKPEVELHVEACMEDEVPVLRRRGGGCAVVLDSGNVVVSVALPVSGIGGNPGYFRRLGEWLVEGLARCGVVRVRGAGASDLAVGDGLAASEARKVGGACIYRTRDILYYSATLLVEPRVALMERYLRHPPREPAYRQGRRHADFVGSLALAGWRGDANSLARALAPELERAFRAFEEEFGAQAMRARP